MSAGWAFIGRFAIRSPPPAIPASNARLPPERNGRGISGWQPGGREGKEIVQLYLHDKQSTLHRPVHELKAFEKIRLHAGESREVALNLPPEAFACFDPAREQWLVEKGKFEIRIGASGRDIRLRGEVAVAGDVMEKSVDKGEQDAFADLRSGLKVSDAAFAAMPGRPVPAIEPPHPYHLHSTLGELKQNRLGRKFADAVMQRAMKSFGVEGNAPGAKIITRALEHTPLRSVVLLSGGAFNFRQMGLWIDLFNRHYLRALAKIFLRR